MHLSPWTLPGGYFDAMGALHKQFELRPLVGKEEELLAQMQSGYTFSSAALVSEILLRCLKRLGDVPVIDRDTIKQLLVGDRQYLLLMLRQLTFGDRIQSTLSCPWKGCNKRIDIDFKASDIPITRCEHLASTYRLKIPAAEIPGFTEAHLTDDSILEVDFRLPNGADQEEIGPYLQENEAQALSILLQRCIFRIGDIESPDLELIGRLPGELRRRLEQGMEAQAPYVELTMEIDCPECQRSFVAPFELQDFFFGDLQVNTDTLYREVHYLAFHYHWSEEEIMQMPRAKRHQYINVLSDEIERLNDATL